MNRKSCLFARCATICLTVVLMAATASARTVYDAGKALRENCETGGKTNPYGVWSYHLSNVDGYTAAATAALSSENGRREFASVSSGTIDGFSINTAQGGSIRTIVSGSPITTPGEPLEVDELFMFPANSDTQCPLIRFTAPEAGWYSAFVSAHDLAKDATAATSSGRTLWRLTVFSNPSAPLSMTNR